MCTYLMLRSMHINIELFVLLNFKFQSPESPPSLQSHFNVSKAIFATKPPGLGLINCIISFFTWCHGDSYEVKQHSIG
jgi:hypothetical protein